MNRAEIRTWKKMAVSAVGLLYVGGTLVVDYVYGWPAWDRASRIPHFVLGLLATIPLILLVLLDHGWRRVFDERDLHIERQAQPIGAIASFGLLGVAAVLALAMDPHGSIRTHTLPRLIYVAFLVGVFAGSAAALIQYNRGARHGE